jgi:hypothetical protein
MPTGEARTDYDRVLAGLDLCQWDQLQVVADAAETGEQLRNKFLTLREMSVLDGNQRDPRSDVTALCAIFYFCLTGHAPGMLHDGRGRPPHRREGYSVREAMGESPHLQQVEAFLDKGFATDVEDRFQSAEKAVERLQRLTAVSEPRSFDLQQLSKEQGERVRRHRREVRLAEYSARLQPLPHQLLASMNTLGQRLSPPFSLTIGAGNPFPGEDTQGSMLLPSLAGITVLVMVSGFPLARGAIFAFRVEGEQVVFMQRFAWHERGRWNAEGAWEKVLWFDPNQPPSPDGFTRWMEGALAKVIREIADRACSG